MPVKTSLTKSFNPPLLWCGQSCESLYIHIHIHVCKQDFYYINMILILTWFLMRIIRYVQFRWSLCAPTRWITLINLMICIQFPFNKQNAGNEYQTISICIVSTNWTFRLYWAYVLVAVTTNDGYYIDCLVHVNIQSNHNPITVHQSSAIHR